MLLSILFCWYNSAAATEPSANSAHLPKIVYVEEMKPFLEGFNSASNTASSALASDVLQSFQKEWQTVAASISAQVHPADLHRISRWAKAEMASFTLPTDWLSQLPMEPLTQTQNPYRMLFSQAVSQGFPLPSHSPIVFRRAIAAAEFDTRTGRIIKVFITIMGWREE